MTIMDWLENVIQSSEQNSDELLSAVKEIFNREEKIHEPWILYLSTAINLLSAVAIFISGIIFSSCLPGLMGTILPILLLPIFAFSLKKTMDSFTSEYLKFYEIKASNIKSELGDVLKLTEKNPQLSLRGLFSQDFDYNHPSADLCNPATIISQ